jgi:hypothetical protein
MIPDRNKTMRIANFVISNLVVSISNANAEINVENVKPILARNTIPKYFDRSDTKLNTH